MHCTSAFAAAIWILAISPLHDPCSTSLASDAATELRGLVNGDLPELRWPNFSAYRADVEKFYGTSNYGLEWTRDGQPTTQAQAVIEALETGMRKDWSPRTTMDPVGRSVDLNCNSRFPQRGLLPASTWPLPSLLCAMSPISTSAK